MELGICGEHGILHGYSLLEGFILGGSIVGHAPEVCGAGRGAPVDEVVLRQTVPALNMFLELQERVCRCGALAASHERHFDVSLGFSLVAGFLIQHRVTRGDEGLKEEAAFDLFFVQGSRIINLFKTAGRESDHKSCQDLETPATGRLQSCSILY